MRCKRNLNRIKEQFYSKGYQACQKDHRKNKQQQLKRQTQETKDIGQELTDQLWQQYEFFIQHLHTVNKNNKDKNKKIHIPVEHIKKIMQHHFILPYEEYQENKIYEEIVRTIIQ
jgi:hypothetical protein